MEFAIGKAIALVVVVIVGIVFAFSLRFWRTRHGKVVDTDGAKVPSTGKTLAACIIVTAAGCITILPYLAAAFMMFDAPRATESLMTWLAFMAAFSLPVLIAGSIIRLWVLFSKGAYLRASRTAIFTGTLAAGPFVLLALWALISSIK